LCRGREVVGLCDSPWTRGGDYYYYARSVEEEGGGELGSRNGYVTEEERDATKGGHRPSRQSPVAMCFEILTDPGTDFVDRMHGGSFGTNSAF
jgi:hypothetical protein